MGLFWIAHIYQISSSGVGGAIFIDSLCLSLKVSTYSYFAK